MEKEKVQGWRKIYLQKIYQKKHNSISFHIALINKNIVPYIFPQFQFEKQVRKQQQQKKIK